jgi:hypothetical protein
MDPYTGCLAGTQRFCHHSALLSPPNAHDHGSHRTRGSVRTEEDPRLRHPASRLPAQAQQSIEPLICCDLIHGGGPCRCCMSRRNPLRDCILAGVAGVGLELLNRFKSSG